jgi:hypothetical protein
MLMPIAPSHWQTLRALARSRKPVLGRDLRVAWTRQTKGGTFLLELVRIGLLEVVGENQPRPFDSLYKLTDAGKHAAEFGEYECGQGRIAAPVQPQGSQKEPSSLPPACNSSHRGAIGERR